MTANAFTPELLVPAGDMEKLETAILYGADASISAETASTCAQVRADSPKKDLPRP